MSQDDETVGHYLLHLPLFWGVVGLSIVVFGLVLYEIYVQGPEIEHKSQAQQTMLDSMSCQQLGKWLIDNSKNYTYGYTYIKQNYQYGEAKYLVCTHGGLSP